MINWRIAGTWQNWLIVFCMFAIAMAGVHLATSYFTTPKKGTDDNG